MEVMKFWWSSKASQSRQWAALSVGGVADQAEGGADKCLAFGKEGAVSRDEQFRRNGPQREE